MKRPNRLWITCICTIGCILSFAQWVHQQSVYAQQQTGIYDDGSFYITAFVDVDSNYNLYVASYMLVEFDEYEDITAIEVDGSADQDDTYLTSAYAEGDDNDPAAFSLQSNAPVPTAHEYGMESDGYACYDDGEGDCEVEPVGLAYAYVNIGTSPPTITSLSTYAVQQGDQGTLTITGSNLVENSADQLTINYSGSGMPFTLTGTPSFSTATYSYDFSGYDVGTYTVSVTNNEGRSNSKAFTVNPPQQACSQSNVPNAVTLQIAGLGSGNQSGTFTVSHPTAAAASAKTTVSYGRFSTPSSVASSIASAITRSYAYLGITAQSNGPAITLQSRGTFGSVSASSSNSTFGFSIGAPSSVSCVVLPTLPCLGLDPDYDTARLYTTDGITETPRQHIIRKHILGSPSLTEPNTVYANTINATTDELFDIVKGYNLTTFLLSPKINGAYSYTFPKRTIDNVEFGLIGHDGAGKDLYTNLLRLSSDRCYVNTSYPVAP